MPQEHRLEDALARLVESYVVVTMVPRPGDVPGDAAVPERVEVRHLPLLLQLEKAIYSGTGAHAAGNTSGADRIPLDPGALAMRDNIAAIARTWYAGMGLPAVMFDTRGTLIEWGRAFAAAHADGSIGDVAWERRIARLHQWAEQIEALFDPPKVVPLASPCPTCSTAWASNRDGERVQALVVEYWLDGELIRKAEARCRNAECEDTWTGIEGIQQLMALVLQHEADQAAVEDAATVFLLTGALPVVTA